MRKFANLGFDRGERPESREGERGLTLVELIATVTLLPVVLGVIYASITFGVGAYHKVRIENALRDEGDLIMSSIISELYRTGPERIIQWQTSDHAIKLVLPKVDNEGGTEDVIADDYIVIQPNKSGKSALFIGSLADIQNKTTETDIESEIVEPSSLKLVCSGSLVDDGCSSGLLEIKLKLRQSYGGRDYDLDLESKFGF